MTDQPITEDIKKTEEKIGETKDKVLSEFKQTNFIQLIIGSAVGWVVWMVLDKTLDKKEKKDDTEPEPTPTPTPQTKDCKSFWTMPPPPVERPAIVPSNNKYKPPHKKISFWG